MIFPIMQRIYKVFCIKHETKTMLECFLFINLMSEHRNNGCVNHETMDILHNIKLLVDILEFHLFIKYLQEIAFYIC